MTEQADWETRTMREYMAALDREQALHEAALKERDMLEDLSVFRLLEITRGTATGALLDELISQTAQNMAARRLAELEDL